MRKLVNGRLVEMTAQEIAARELESAANLAGTVLMNLKVEIYHLEAQITPRRLREAVLGTDGGWLAQHEAKIAKLREGL
jgi:hypothetical protein